MSDLGGNPEDRFSHNEAHLFMYHALLVSRFFCCGISRVWVGPLENYFFNCLNSIPIKPNCK